MRTLTLCSRALTIAIAISPAVAMAGPCSDDIAAIGKQLSQNPAMGPATTGALAGSGPGSVAKAPAIVTDNKGTSADRHVGGTAGTKELNAASANVATSDADVRQQQLGHPTAAGQAKASGGVETAPGSQTAGTGRSDDSMSRAKMAWQKAVDLNAQNDEGCKGAVEQARKALKGT